ncbi:MAG: hypothetical protein M0R77_16960 [Gammaproteobacteria bacterium]|nr:hypothetical protein [Gammaproteobacteria bacterium]
MAAINNFSLVGIGSSVKLGKGGIVLAQSGGKLTVIPQRLLQKHMLLHKAF